MRHAYISESICVIRYPGDRFFSFGISDYKTVFVRVFFKSIVVFRVLRVGELCSNIVFVHGE